MVGSPSPTTYRTYVPSRLDFTPNRLLFFLDDPTNLMMQTLCRELTCESNFSYLLRSGRRSGQSKKPGETPVGSLASLIKSQMDADAQAPKENVVDEIAASFEDSKNFLNKILSAKCFVEGGSSVMKRVTGAYSLVHDEELSALTLAASSSTNEGSRLPSKNVFLLSPHTSVLSAFKPVDPVLTKEKLKTGVSFNLLKTQYIANPSTLKVERNFLIAREKTAGDRSTCGTLNGVDVYWLPVTELSSTRLNIQKDVSESGKRKKGSPEVLILKLKDDDPSSASSSPPSPLPEEEETKLEVEAPPSSLDGEAVAPEEGIKLDE